MRRQLFYAGLLSDPRAAKEIRLFGLSGHFVARMIGELGFAQAAEARTDRRVLRTELALGALTAIVSGTALIETVRASAPGPGLVGNITVLIAALAGVQNGLAGLVTQLAQADQTLILYGAHVALTDSAPAPDPGSGMLVPLPPLASAIEFRAVWFRYRPESDWVLRGVDLTLELGRSVALVGLNGAGKSTLIKLLCRLYEPTQGSITWDGVDLRDIPPERLRARIAALFQDFMAYDLSAGENIALGDLAALDDVPAQRAAAEVAGIDAVLGALPAGYDTPLTRTFAPPAVAGKIAAGVVLSGGQWQRVAIARAVLRSDAQLLILDEPSSGLDAVAEREIHERLRTLRGGRTSLLISHRLSAVRDADRIVVLEGGVIAEQGTHEELIASGGRYRVLFEMQAAGYQDVPHGFASIPAAR
jgi:ATP-binding cassette subfamily B protein